MRDAVREAVIGRFERLHPPSANRDVGTQRDELLGDRQADSRTATGHDRDVTLEEPRSKDGHAAG